MIVPSSKSCVMSEFTSLCFFHFDRKGRYDGVTLTYRKPWDIIPTPIALHVSSPDMDRLWYITPLLLAPKEKCIGRKNTQTAVFYYFLSIHFLHEVNRCGKISDFIFCPSSKTLKMWNFKCSVKIMAGYACCG